jgi:hypothetical protein
MHGGISPVSFFLWNTPIDPRSQRAHLQREQAVFLLPNLDSAWGNLAPKVGAASGGSARAWSQSCREVVQVEALLP